MHTALLPMIHGSTPPAAAHAAPSAGSETDTEAGAGFEAALNSASEGLAQESASATAGAALPTAPAAASRGRKSARDADSHPSHSDARAAASVDTRSADNRAPAGAADTGEALESAEQANGGSDAGDTPLPDWLALLVGQSQTASPSAADGNAARSAKDGVSTDAPPPGSARASTVHRNAATTEADNTAFGHPGPAAVAGKSDPAAHARELATASQSDAFAPADIRGQETDEGTPREPLSSAAKLAAPSGRAATHGPAPEAAAPKDITTGAAKVGTPQAEQTTVTDGKPGIARELVAEAEAGPIRIAGRRSATEPSEAPAGEASRVLSTNVEASGPAAPARPRGSDAADARRPESTAPAAAQTPPPAGLQAAQTPPPAGLQAALQGPQIIVPAAPVPNGTPGLSPRHATGVSLDATRARRGSEALSLQAEAQARSFAGPADAFLTPSTVAAVSWSRVLEAAQQGSSTAEAAGWAVDRLHGATGGTTAPTASTAESTGGAALFETRVDAALQSPEFAPALGARIATLARDGIEQARVALNPAEMGPVSVQLELSGTQVRVELAAEIEATRLALEQALPALAGSLREAGFTLTGGGVFQQARGDASGQGAGNDRGAAGATGLQGERGTAMDEVIAPARAGGRAPRGLVDLYA